MKPHPTRRNAPWCRHKHSVHSCNYLILNNFLKAAFLPCDNAYFGLQKCLFRSAKRPVSESRTHKTTGRKHGPDKTRSKVRPLKGTVVITLNKAQKNAQLRLR